MPGLEGASGEKGDKGNQGFVGLPGNTGPQGRSRFGFSKVEFFNTIQGQFRMKVKVGEISWIFHLFQFNLAKLS